jgi:hypothetical protein
MVTPVLHMCEASGRHRGRRSAYGLATAPEVRWQLWTLRGGNETPDR